MTDTEHRTDPRYTPYQADFFHRFVSEAEPGSVHLLVAAPGTGKSFAMAGSICHLVRTGEVRRVLILAPAALVPQWGNFLSDLDQESVAIDGRALRLLRERIGNSPEKWPTGLCVMSIDLAKRDDALELVSAVPWNLVVVDEAHLVAGQRLRLVEDLAGKEHPPALLLATSFGGEAIQAFAGRARVFDWRRAVAESRSREGHGPEMPPDRVTRSYRRSDEEVAVARKVLSIARDPGNMKDRVLVQRAASSISSLEESLVRWVEAPDEPLLATLDGAENPEEGQAVPIPESRDHRGALEQLLQQVEELGSDSKLDCFNTLIGELVGGGVRHIVVFCEYRATLEYLAAAVERLDFPDYRLHTGMAAEHRREVLDSYHTGGGLLIATSASGGVPLDFVEAAIHYDLPLSLMAFARREGRYHSYGRKQPCTVYFLDDESGALPLEGLLLRNIQKFDLINESMDSDIGELFQEALLNPQPNRDEVEEGQ